MPPGSACNLIVLNAAERFWGGKDKRTSRSSLYLPDDHKGVLKNTMCESRSRERHLDERNPEAFWDNLAVQIAEAYHPNTVLIAGNAMGQLTQKLRKRDIACYEAGKSETDDHAECLKGSPDAGLPAQFDLIVDTRGFDCLCSEHGSPAIRDFFEKTDRVLVCAGVDQPDAACCDRHQPWRELAEGFARDGFFEDLLNGPSLSMENAVCFVRKTDAYEQIGEYACSLRKRELELRQAEEDKRAAEKLLWACRAELHSEQEHGIIEGEKQKKKIEFLMQQVESYRNSGIWRITAPYRFVMDRLKASWLGRGLLHVKRRGMGAALADAKKRLTSPSSYKISKAERKQQTEAEFSQRITISILVPLYNTPSKYLREMIHSVKAQTYLNWELCLADGSDAEHAYVGKIVGSYSRDKRIRYRKLEKNLGISENTNACIAMATGQYIALLDHDDLLHPSALYEVMKAICEKDADFVYTDESVFRNTPEDVHWSHFKPDYAPDTLRANNYICHFTCFKKDLLSKAGLFRRECDGSQDFDMVLRLTEQAQCIVHIPKILYFWRAHKDSVAENVSAKPYVIEAAHRAVSDHLKRVGLKGEVLDSVVPSMYRLKYEIEGHPLISILIPNKDHADDLRRCIDSILYGSTYDHYEIIVIENNSESREIFEYYETLKNNPRIRIVRWDGKFNYSAINNYGAAYARGEHILLLNNDTEIISPDWLQEMLMYSQRSDVGAVGAKLYYPDHTIQHAGVCIGLYGLAGHYHRGFDGNDTGYMGRLIYAQNVSAVTAACIMMRRSVFEQMHGLDETFEVAYNDVDLCMRIRAAGYLIVWTPYAELLHYESKSRGLEDTPDRQRRFADEKQRLRSRWAKELADGDPYYNPNLTINREDFSRRD